MNRAERRRLMRAQGWRGQKAKRQRLGAPPIDQLPPGLAEQMAQHEADMADRAVRNSGREMGLVIPPSASEAKQLRERGTNVGGGGLVLPPGGAQ